MRFENAFCHTAQCRPSRFTIWTGRYARSHGLVANRVSVDPPHTTMAELFREAGYRTASIGKHHMSKSRTSDRGFDEVIDLADYGEWLPEVRDRLPEAREGPRPGELYGVSSLDPELHHTGFWTRRTLEFLRDAERPFFLWCSFYRPHVPIDPTRVWADRYDPDELTLPPNASYAFDRDVPGFRGTREDGTPLYTEEEHRRILALYYAVVSEVDDAIGRILAGLDELGLADETIVLFTSDHGGFISSHGMWKKGSQGYDELMRVPLLWRVPGRGEAGAVRAELAGLVDVLPTLVELCGLEAPPGLQGQSLAGLLAGRDEPWRETVFNEFGHPAAANTLVARSRTAKYVLYRDGDRPVHEQFFDLERDPWEMSNAADDPSFAAAIAALRDELERWDRETARAPALE